MDGVPVQLLPRRKQDFVAHDWFAMDAGPFYLRGGRHTLEARADVADRFEDYGFRYDNEAYRQVLWTPEPLPATPNPLYSADGPPLPFVAGQPDANNHAYSFATCIYTESHEVSASWASCLERTYRDATGQQTA